MTTRDVPKRIRDRIPADWTATDILAAGESGLMAIDGIGPASARQLIAAAEDAQADAAQPATESGETTPTLPLPDFCEIRLVGAETAVVGNQAMWRGEIRTVRYGVFAQASAEHPDIFLVRRVGEAEFRSTL